MSEIEWSPEVSRMYAAYMEQNLRYDHRPWAERVVRDLPEQRPGMVLLDVAGGPAFLSLEVAALLARPRVIVTDLSPTMLEIARERAAARTSQIETRVCPADKLDVPEGSIDIAVCKHFVRLARDVDAVFAEMGRVLKPGGRAYIIDFDGEAPWLTGQLLEIWVRLTAPRFLREGFTASRRSGLPFSSLPARLTAAGLKDAVVLRRGVASMVRAVRPSPARPDG